MLAAIFACIVSVGVLLGLTFRLEHRRPGVSADGILAVQSWALWAAAGAVLLLGIMTELNRRRPLPAIPGSARFNAVFLVGAAAAIATILWLAAEKGPL
ncbi:MAG: hypothetical protein AB7O88_26555 [Reyranellaceae bacterium]